MRLCVLHSAWALGTFHVKCKCTIGLSLLSNSLSLLGLCVALIGPFDKGPFDIFHGLLGY